MGKQRKCKHVSDSKISINCKNTQIIATVLAHNKCLTDVYWLVVILDCMHLFWDLILHMFWAQTQKHFGLWLSYPIHFFIPGVFYHFWSSLFFLFFPSSVEEGGNSGLSSVHYFETSLVKFLLNWKNYSHPSDTAPNKNNPHCLPTFRRVRFSHGDLGLQVQVFLYLQWSYLSINPS